MQTEIDVLIVGGGLVGASLAIALDRSHLRVGLVETIAPSGNAVPARYDERNLALSRASVNALSALGVWQHVAESSTPITRVHVSRQGEFGVVRLNAAEHGVEAFGATLPARELGRGLGWRLQQCAQLVRFVPATLKSMRVTSGVVIAQVAAPDGDVELHAKLIVGADGTQSFVRSALNIQSDNVDYAQTAFVTTVTPERDPAGCAYERFTASGPVALLPLTEHRAGIVLTVPDADAARVAALDDAGFVDLLYARFGYRLGRISRCGARSSYALRRVIAQRTTSVRSVLVGNAAQTLHPIAAQGFNLGLRDALTLAELVSDSPHADPGDAHVLRNYVARRQADRSGTAAMSDGLARWTASEALPLPFLRSAAMLALDRIAPLQNVLVRHGMGFRGDIPQLTLRDLA